MCCCTCLHNKRVVNHHYYQSKHGRSRGLAFKWTLDNFHCYMEIEMYFCWRKQSVAKYTWSCCIFCPDQVLRSISLFITRALLLKTSCVCQSEKRQPLLPVSDWLANLRTKNSPLFYSKVKTHGFQRTNWKAKLLCSASLFFLFANTTTPWPFGTSFK